MPFLQQQQQQEQQQTPRKARRVRNRSDSSFDDSEGEDLPESVVGPIEIPKSPSHPASSRVDSTPGMKAPSHINFAAHSPHQQRLQKQQQQQMAANKQNGTATKWPQQLYRQWFGAITEGRSIQVHSILADHPDILNIRRREPTPFHMALTHIASEWLGNDTTDMDGLQVAIMGYKNAYANWRLGNGGQSEQMAGMSADQMKEHVAVREVILGALIDAVSPEQLDSHFFGRQYNSTLHLAAFYNDANLVERLLRQGAAIDIANRMGFLPTGITNDKPTLQWLSMYSGQVRGSRYPIPSPGQEKGQRQTDEKNSSNNSHFAESELEIGKLEPFSDEEETTDDVVSESSYIKRFADSPRLSARSNGDNTATQAKDTNGFEDDDDNVSVHSSSDRGSLGLGGKSDSKASLAKSSHESLSLRQRAHNKSNNNASGEIRPASRASEASAAPSAMSFHTAEDGPAGRSESATVDQEEQPDRDATVRIKLDADSIDDDQLDDIFSDTDEVVQMEPSFCRSGSGLSENSSTTTRKVSSPSPSKHLSLTSSSSMSSSGSITMQSLSKALAMASSSSGFDNEGSKPTNISAFPVEVPEINLSTIQDFGNRPSQKVISQIKQQESSASGKDGDNGPPRATSPFMLRDSLYEMIMGKTQTRPKAPSVAGSVASNTFSNSSTVGSSKDNVSVTSSGALRSPTSPTSRISPTSTSFDDSTCSPSNSAMTSPTDDLGFPESLKTKKAKVPETVPEEEGNEDEVKDASTNRSESLVPAPRPTAASLFASMDMAAGAGDDVDEGFDVDEAYHSAMSVPVSSEIVEPFPSPPIAADTAETAGFKMGRIGRRQGRATAEYLHDDDPSSGFCSEPTFDFVRNKSSSNSLVDRAAKAAKTDTSDVENDDSETNMGLPSDAPLTRDKRDIYLQTLISRNTMRTNGSPDKPRVPSVLTTPFRPESPSIPPISAASDSAAESGEDGDIENDHLARPTYQNDSYRRRHMSKHSESALDSFKSSGRGPGVLDGNSSISLQQQNGYNSSHREALSVSGASINGRIRSQTMNNLNAPSPTSPAKVTASPTRKVSPSLALLRNRNLVSKYAVSQLQDAGNGGSISRGRAMSTPADATSPVFPPSHTTPSLGPRPSSSSNKPPVVAGNTARIGRVAALSQTFERQQDPGNSRALPSHIAIPAARSVDKQALETASAPLSNKKKTTDLNTKPATRSNSVSSSHSAGGHGQNINAGNNNTSQQQQQPPSPPRQPGGGQDQSGSAGGNGNGNGGDDGDGDKPSPDPPHAILDPASTDDSNGSTTSHSSSGIGAHVGNSEATDTAALLDSSGSSDQVGSSIFDSSESRSSSSRDPLPILDEKRALHAPIAPRHEPSNTSGSDERSRRFKELANRRKSGTLERMSKSGLVKSRRAWIADSSGSNPFKPSSSLPVIPTATSNKQRLVKSKESASFFERRGEGEGRRRDIMPGGGKLTASSSSPSFASVKQRAETLQQKTSNTSLHPAENVVYPPASSGSSSSYKTAPALEPPTLAGDNSEKEPTALSRGSGSNKSSASSSSGDGSLHVLSSLDTSSTNGISPLDSSGAQDSNKMGLMAQYSMNQKKIDRQLKRMSKDSEYNYFSSQHDLESVEPTDDNNDNSDSNDGYDTLMPVRPQNVSRSLFGLSAVAEEEDEVYEGQDPIPISAPAIEEAKAEEVVEMQERRRPSPKVTAEAGFGEQQPSSSIGDVKEPETTVADYAKEDFEASLPMLTTAAEADIQPLVVPQVVEHDDHQQRQKQLRSASSHDSHLFDPSSMFGYHSEESSTMASRSSLDRSERFTQGGLSSSSSRVMYLYPFDHPDQPEDGYSADSEVPNKPSTSLITDSSDSDMLKNSSSADVGMAAAAVTGPSTLMSDKRRGKEPERRLPEMQQIQPSKAHEPVHVPTVEEIEAGLSTDEEPIPKIYYMRSQSFDGYVPFGHQLHAYQEELRKEKRMQKEAKKKGIKLPPPSPPHEEEFELLDFNGEKALWLQPELWPDSYLTPAEKQEYEIKYERYHALKMSKMDRPTEHPDLKRDKDSLAAGTISSWRLRKEFLDTISRGKIDTDQLLNTSYGTIKPLVKRPRTSKTLNIFDEPRSFLDSVDIPMSDMDDEDIQKALEDEEGEQDAIDAFLYTQEFQDPSHPWYKEWLKMPGAQAMLEQTPPRKRLVLRTARGKKFSERVMSEVDGLKVTVNTDIQGTVTTREAGQLAYEPPAGTVRPANIPQYVSKLNGMPDGPFFNPPKASAKSGYLYMRILSIEEVEDKADSVYFVIRNGIDTLATTPISVGGARGTTINQEFRILTDPNVSITIWMRFRSDAILYKGGGNGASRQSLNEPGCMPPLLKKLVRRNTRTRNNNKWNCSNERDSVFDFNHIGSKYGHGAKKTRPSIHMKYPERVSSVAVNGYDPRSLNATQAPSSVFYDPGADSETTDHQSLHKGLVQAKFKEETRGVAVVHVGEMIEEVFLRGLVDSWDVENVWESRRGAQLQLQLFFIPGCSLFREEELPKTLSDCETAMEICKFHNRTLNSGYMSQRGGDTRFWRRRYFRLIGGFLFAYHEDTKEPRCFIDLNDATNVIDNETEMKRQRQLSTANRSGGADLMRTAGARRRPTHKRNNSDHSSRDGARAPIEQRHLPRQTMPAGGHEYASDSEAAADLVDIADPALQRSPMRKRQPRGGGGVQRDSNTDSGVVSENGNHGALDSGMQHSFSVEFGEGGFIEFYTESESEKKVWVEMIRRILGHIPKIPSWLIKLLHADVSERIDEDGSTTTLSNGSSTEAVDNSKFHELARSHVF